MKPKTHKLYDIIFLFVTAVFVIAFINKNYQLVSLSLDFVSLAGALLLCILAYILHALASYFWLANRHDGSISVVEYMESFFRGNIARYIPGNVWAYLLRYRYGKKVGIRPHLLAVSMLHEVYWFIFSSAAWCWWLLSIPLMWKLAMFVLTILAIWLFWQKFLLRFAPWWLKRFGITNENDQQSLQYTYKDVKVILLYALLWFGWGGALLIITNQTFGAEVVKLILTTAIFAGSYLVGFLSFFTPSGLGAREAIVVVLLSPKIGVQLAYVVSIWSRLVFVISEVLLYVCIKIAIVLTKKSSTT